MRLILELQRNLCDLHEVKKIKTPFFKERNVRYNVDLEIFKVKQMGSITSLLKKLQSGKVLIYFLIPSCYRIV